MSIIKTMAEIGNPNSVTDAGVGALAARSAVLGAFMNVKVNAADLEDQEYVLKVLNDGAQIEAEAMRLEAEIIRIVAERHCKSHSFTSGPGHG